MTKLSVWKSEEQSSGKNHIWRIKKEYFRQLDCGDKGIEIRVGYAHIKKVHAGDTITFENYGPNSFDVVRIGVYRNFAEMLKAEGVERVLPGMTFDGALKTLRHIYGRDKEALGVYAFELCRSADRRNAVEIYRASDLLQSGDTMDFSELVADSYALTDWITKDYPDHCAHFYGKYVPGVFDGTREIVVCYLGGKPVATACLKKDPEERKISTLYVLPECQKRGIATKLLEQCFDWLGTTRPVVTIADYKLDQFASIIQKYGWTETEVLGDGFYNDHSREHVFNGAA